MLSLAYYDEGDIDNHAESEGTERFMARIEVIIEYNLLDLSCYCIS